MSINTDLLHAEQLHAKLWGSYEPVAMAHISRSIRLPPMSWTTLMPPSI